jgi:hypothetical protein
LPPRGRSNLPFGSNLLFVVDFDVSAPRGGDS